MRGKSATVNRFGIYVININYQCWAEGNALAKNNGKNMKNYGRDGKKNVYNIIGKIKII